MLYIDQLGVIYRYLKVCSKIHDILFMYMMMHLRHEEAFFCLKGGGEMGKWVLGEGGITTQITTTCNYCIINLNMWRSR